MLHLLCKFKKTKNITIYVTKSRETHVNKHKEYEGNRGKINTNGNNVFSHPRTPSEQHIRQKKKKVNLSLWKALLNRQTCKYICQDIWNPLKLCGYRFLSDIPEHLTYLHGVISIYYVRVLTAPEATFLFATWPPSSVRSAIWWWLAATHGWFFPLNS